MFKNSSGKLPLLLPGLSPRGALRGSPGRPPSWSLSVLPRGLCPGPPSAPFTHSPWESDQIPAETDQTCRPLSSAPGHPLAPVHAGRLEGVRGCVWRHKFYYVTTIDDLGPSFFQSSTKQLNSSSFRTQEWTILPDCLSQLCGLSPTLSTHPMGTPLAPLLWVLMHQIPSKTPSYI